MESIVNARISLGSLTVFRGILKDGAVEKYGCLLEAAHGVDLRGFVEAYGAFYAELLARGAASAASYIAEKAVYDDNVFARSAAAAGRAVADTAVFSAASHDLAALGRASLPARAVKKAAAAHFAQEGSEAYALIMALPEWEDGVPLSQDAAALADFYKKNGCGEFARYGAFRWADGHLCGIENPDPIALCDLKGYEYERGVVVENTRQFLDGSTANNMLLYGDRGTGKSSTVKAVCNAYRERGLRIIEVPKNAIADFAGITAKIASLPLKFIIFIDDLSFAGDDDNYAALKGVLEGGVAVRPRNTVIYATTNRRHFVKETLAERESEDLHAADAMQEKLSLADRFGITVTFSAPDQKLYLEIVNGLAKELGLAADKAKLERAAIQWALYYNGRSPRTARHFIDWAQARLKDGRDLSV